MSQWAVEAEYLSGSFQSLCGEFLREARALPRNDANANAYEAISRRCTEVLDCARSYRTYIEEKAPQPSDRFDSLVACSDSFLSKDAVEMRFPIGRHSGEMEFSAPTEPGPGSVRLAYGQSILKKKIDFFYLMLTGMIRHETGQYFQSRAALQNARMMSEGQGVTLAAGEWLRDPRLTEVQKALLILEWDHYKARSGTTAEERRNAARILKEHLNVPLLRQREREALDAIRLPSLKSEPAAVEALRRKNGFTVPRDFQNKMQGVAATLPACAKNLDDLAAGRVESGQFYAGLLQLQKCAAVLQLPGVEYLGTAPGYRAMAAFSLLLNGVINSILMFPAGSIAPLTLYLETGENSREPFAHNLLSENYLLVTRIWPANPYNTQQRHLYHWLKYGELTHGKDSAAFRAMVQKAAQLEPSSPQFPPFHD